MSIKIWIFPWKEKNSSWTHKAKHNYTLSTKETHRTERQCPKRTTLNNEILSESSVFLSYPPNLTEMRETVWLNKKYIYELGWMRL